MDATARAGHGAFVRALALLASAAFLASCSDLPTRPRQTIAVTGQVLDRDGAPLPGARLYFRNEEFDPADPYQYGEYPELPPQMLGEAVSGPDGRFELDLWSGRYGVTVSPPYGAAYGGLSRTGVPVTPGMAPLTFRYQGVWLRGSLLGPGSLTVEDGRVEAYPVAGQTPGGHRVCYATDGTYEMLLPPGVYDVVAAPYFTNAGIPRLVFYSVPVRADTTVNLVLDGTQVHGTVRGQGGSPLTGVAITVDKRDAWCEARTLADGSFTLYTPPGVYRALFYPQPPLDYIFAREFPLVVGESPETRDFDLSGVTWSGTVRWAGTGQPVPGAVVNVYPVTLDFGSAWSTTDASGTFLLIVPEGELFEVGVRGGTYPSNFARSVGFLIAGADSTFDILVEPPGQPAATPPPRPR